METHARFSSLLHGSDGKTGEDVRIGIVYSEILERCPPMANDPCFTWGKRTLVKISAELRIAQALLGERERKKGTRIVNS